MGSVIGVLARIGADASLRYAPAETLAALLCDEAADTELAAVQGRAAHALWFMTQIPPKPDRDVDDPFGDDDGDDDRPDDAPDDDDDDDGEHPGRRRHARLRPHPAGHDLRPAPRLP